MCPIQGDWFWADEYELQFAHPDDDTSQELRKVIIDDEQAKIYMIEYCVYPSLNGNVWN